MKFLIVFICFWEFAVINGIKVYRFGPEDGFMCHCKKINEQCDKQTGYCTSGCARAWFGPGCQYRDLAQLVGSVVSQTETNEKGAEKTADGDENSCSSEKTTNPWWKIWLPHNETITELYIISKAHRLKHFISTTVFIEYVPDAYKRNKTYEPQLSQLCYKADNVRPESASFVIKCDQHFAGNQVRIQLVEDRRLVLCEVRINGGRNLAFGQHTHQSSTLYNSETHSSSKAVDGDMATCSWTTDYDNTAWWRLTFGYTAIIQHIKVTQKTGYKTGVTGWLSTASNEYKHYREDDGNSQHVVYKEVVGIYIKPKTGRSITVCETDLYGDCGENLCGFNCKTECHCQNMTIWTRIYANCSTAEKKVDKGRNVDRREECPHGKYGNQCNMTCSENCGDNCNHVNGSCEGNCKVGWKGDKCDEIECSYNTYGQGCEKTCSTNCKHGTCNHVSGKCDDGCKDGWEGDKCEDACEAGKFGQACQHHCIGNCEGGNNFCNHADGTCKNECIAGWRGKLCSEKCAPGKYGYQCRQECSVKCKDNKCNHTDGKCEIGCQAGFDGYKCQYPCYDGWYGEKCSKTCSKNCLAVHNTNNCSNVDGVCLSGCKPGWRTPLCNTVCPQYKYGPQCKTQCSWKCKHHKCNHVDGECDGGCKDGWQGDQCLSPCYDGWFGENCSKTCSKNCLAVHNTNKCSNVDGVCLSGCKPGWRTPLCNAECPVGNYGNKCSKVCSDHCIDVKCNLINGTCENGCKAGWQGDLCNSECVSGKYGDQCGSTCSKHCRGYYGCNNVNGSCLNGCKSGWLGEKCEDECVNGKWGVGCNNLCGNCSDGTCDPVDGQCRGNCNIGFKFTPMCNQECDDGFYGSNCYETCGSCHNGTDCDKVTGVCANGCSSGYSGDLCMSVVAKQASAGISIPVGIGAGVFLLLGLCLIVLFVKLGRRRRRVPTDDDVELHHENVNNDSKAGPSVTHAPSQPNKAKVEDDRSKSRVQVSKLLQYVKQNLSNKEKLISEFQTIPYGLKYASAAASLPVNIVKNRYREIYPYDHSRVMLSTIQGKPNSEYVNASYIQGRFRENAYIAAQGPTKESLDDFWRMIWEKDIRTIAILTNLVEEMKVKCIQYWGPQNSETVYGNLTVCNVSEHIFAEYTIRRFKVFYKKDREHDRTVTQFHYTAWPDKGVPRSTSSLVQFWNVVRQADSLKSKTWLVHCSAGVGRTGTFIAMDLLYDEGVDLGTVDIHRCVHTLREQRLNMVQTKEQYKFLHGLAVEMLVLPSKQIHLDAYSALYASLQTIDSPSGKSALLLQYEGLQDEISFMDLVYESCKLPKADDNDDRFAAAKLDANKSKNRYMNVLPANEFRPFLASNVPGCTNYINAVYVQSYCNLRGYILTQTPMKETAIDCCRLLIEEEVKVIVTFNWKGKGKEDVGEYLPDNGTIELGPFTCTKIEETDESNYVLRKHKIVYKTESHETIVYQLMFKNWPTKGVIPSDSHSILDFLQAVEFYNRREAGKAIVVQCLNGAERSGLFVVLMNIMEHLRYESRVSIPHLIRCARVRREQIIPNFEQYKFCHDTLLTYVESNTTYANM